MISHIEQYCYLSNEELEERSLRADNEAIKEVLQERGTMIPGIDNANLITHLENRIKKNEERLKKEL
jgi:hypothetical protein